MSFYVVLHFLIMGLVSWGAASLWFQVPFIERRKKTNGNDLNVWLQNWQLLNSQGSALSKLGPVPEFKFYARLAEAGLRHARTFGSFPRELLWEWREGLSKESDFDRKMTSLKFSSFMQFFIFTLIIWSFGFISSDSIVKLNSSHYISMVTLQLLGFVSFIPVVKLLNNYLLKGLSEMLESLYTLRSLSQAGLAVSEVLKEAKLSQIPERLSGQAGAIRLKLMDLVRAYQNLGNSMGKESQLLISEIWFYRDQQFTAINKRLEALKLIWLLLFFGSSYAVFLMGLVGELLRSN
jgi:hypothetical protein